MVSEEPEVLIDVRGRIGRITLNRPQALNALTQDMCVVVKAHLDNWRTDDAVDAVLVTGAGDKAFCAGGDVVALYKSGLAWKGGDETSTAWRDFFADEYRMNSAIHHFPKPYISLLDGITMGGGVGISVHGSHRIATERTLFAMPETGLGLMPDVGGGYFMPRLPGQSGMYLALTGERLKAAGMCELGIATHFVPGDQLASLAEALENAESLDHQKLHDLLTEFAGNPGEARLNPHRVDVDRHFGANSVEEIVASLKKDGSDWAMRECDRLLTKSPTSMKITFRQLREGAKLEFDAEMCVEYRMVNAIMARHDFYEGVRAILLDKDNAPEWSPARLEDVSDDEVGAHFADLGDLELDLSGPAPVAA